nr:TVP38/TMEM64 family protein [Oscillospiraceae bacterium]
MKRTLTEQQKKTLSVLAIVIFVLLSAALAWFVGRPMVRFARQPEQFRAWVDGHGAWGPLAYAAMVFLQVLVAIIPGEPLEIAGGYAFGAWAGTALC